MATSAFRLGRRRWSSPQLTHTHTHLTAFCPGLPRWAGTRKVKPIWILLKQETVSGSGISWVACKSAPRSRQITTPAPHRSSFLQAGCPSCRCRPTNSVKALKAHRIAISWLMFGSVIGIRLLSKVISQSNNDEWSFYTQYTAIRPDWWATKWKNPGYWQKYPETQTTPKKPRSSGKKTQLSCGNTDFRSVYRENVLQLCQSNPKSQSERYSADLSIVFHFNFSHDE